MDFSISDALTQFSDRKIEVIIEENEKESNLANFISEKQLIDISSYSINEVGVHSLSIAIYDYCYLKSFYLYTTISILPNLPPAVVGAINEVIGYQGQSMVIQRIINLNSLFYDPGDNVDFAMTECIDNITDVISSTMMRYNEASKAIESTFYKSYTGVCKAGILGYDALYQSSILQYYIRILACPQNKWLYCEGPDQYDCTKCVKGYFLENSTKIWIRNLHYIDKWIIICFAIIILLIMIVAEYDEDISVLLLENISIYYIMFLIENIYTTSINFYFDDLILVISNMSSLMFPLYKIIGIAFQGQLSCSFFLNWLFIILIIHLFVIWRKIILNSFLRKYFQNRVKYKLIAKYLMWNMVFVYFWILVEIESIIYTFGMLISFLFSCSALIISLLYLYWFVLNNQSDCLIWNSFKQLKGIKEEFIMISNIHKINYSYFIKYNWIRKILFALIMSLFYKYNFSLYLYAFTIIPLQIIYFWLSFVVSTFLSPVKGLIFVINESMVTVVVVMTSIIYMNTKVNDIKYLVGFSDMMHTWIRIQILGTILFEISRLLKTLCLLHCLVPPLEMD